MNKKVGIVLVNYKDYAKKYLEEAWQSLMLQDYPKDKYYIYIVDNASSQESFSYLSNNYSEAKILSREDGNYAAANNLGANTAISDGCDYIVICNMDTVFEKDWLKELVVSADNNKEAGIIQSKILLYDKENKDSKKINTLGNNLHFLGFGLVSSYGEDDEKISDYNNKFTYASGCSLLIKKEVFEKIGGYNEEFYMYHDDVELSLKARLLGYDIILAPKSVLYHKYEFSRSIRMLYYMERNRLLTLFLFYNTRTLALIALAIIISELGLLIYSLFNSWLVTKLKVYKYFFSFKNIATIRRERKKIKSLKKISDKELFSFVSANLEFGAKPSLVLKLFNPLIVCYYKFVKRLL
ncbi:MAG TPA: glycosyltransferase family 2 protein [Patescibacteria group bacterium]|nr:glycosyltransferase family 2 protein [Patescibacteria group bacterium]